MEKYDDDIITKVSFTVGIVWSREDYIEEAINSIRNQDYKGIIDIIICDNRDRAKSIGECFNSIAEKSDKDVIFFLGDDDFVDKEYIRILNRIYGGLSDQYPGKYFPSVSTFMKIFDSGSDKCKKIDAVCTGSYARHYLLENKFNEELIRFVDCELFDNYEETLGYSGAITKGYYGYYYRQHAGNTSGNEIKVDKWETHKSLIKKEWLDIDFDITKIAKMSNDITITYI